MSDEDSCALIKYINEVDKFSEIFVFIGKKIVKNNSRCLFFKTFEEATVNIKYVILNAYRECKKSNDYSNAIALSIRILNLIQNNPGITSNELSEKAECSKRTIQRYIETLRVAGEWIEYDSAKRGWYLYDNKSLLKGDDLNG